MKKLFEIVTIGKGRGVIVKVHKKRRWTYYDIIFEDTEAITTDWMEEAYQYETYREDQF